MRSEAPPPSPARDLLDFVSAAPTSYHAVAEVEGPIAALRLVDGLALDRYYLFHAIRADLLRRLGRRAESADAYDAAIARCENRAEARFLQKRREELRT